MANEPTTEVPTTDDVTGNIRRETDDLPGIRARVVGEEPDAAADDVAGHMRARLHEQSNDDVFGMRARVEGTDEDDVEGHMRAR